MAYHLVPVGADGDNDVSAGELAQLQQTASAAAPCDWWDVKCMNAAKDKAQLTKTVLIAGAAVVGFMLLRKGRR